MEQSPGVSGGELASKLEAACLPLMEEWLADLNLEGGHLLSEIHEDDMRIYAFLLVRKVIDFVAAEVGVDLDATRGRADFRRQFLDNAAHLVDTMDDQVPHTSGRSRRVAQFAGRLAAMLKLSDSEIADIEDAARIANLGLINTSQKLFSQPRRLSPEELAMARNHSQIGADILKPMEFLGEIAAMVRYHHANWDGSGCPEGIGGEQIPLGARIIRIADAFEALMSDRPHRRAMSRDEALTELLKDSGKAFDPSLVRFSGAM